MATFITIAPFVNTFYFSEAVNNGLNVLGQADYRNQILNWQWKSWYTEKIHQNDPVTLQFHTAQNPALSAPELTICDVRQNTIAAVDLMTAPYLKGYQQIPGNTYVDPLTGYATQLDTTMWSFRFVDFAPDLPPGNYYYLKLRAFISGDENVYFSEPIYLAPTPQSFPNTRLFCAKYYANRSVNTNVVVTGWVDDYGTTAIRSYSPTFTRRCEAFILPFDPKLVNIGYLKQQYEQRFISGQQVPQRILKIGEISTGVPDYMLQAITEFLIADKLYIGQDITSQYEYATYNPSAQTAPSEIWKSSRDDNRPLLRASTTLTLASIAQQAMVTPTPGLPGYYYSRTGYGDGYG